jgi:hypothetical protein
VSFAATVAAARKTTEAAVLESLRASLAKERERLAGLARLLPAKPSEVPASGLDVGALLARLEGYRARFEDAAADALFEKATEFPPGRIASETLARGFDVHWIARILRWDEARLDAWAKARRGAFEQDLEALEVPRILVRAGLEEEGKKAGCDPRRARLAVRARRRSGPRGATSTTPGCWRSCRRSSASVTRPSLEGRTPPDSRSWTRTCGTSRGRSRIRGCSSGPSPRWRARASSGAEPAGARRRGARDGGPWRAIEAKDAHLEGPEAHAALAAILFALEARFTSACDAAVEACLAEGAREHGKAGPLDLSAEAIERAEQEERFLLKDVSSRSGPHRERRGLRLVHLLERDADLYRGFSVGRATRRKIQVRDEDGIPLAHALIGGVRGPTLREILQVERRSEDPDDEGEDSLDAEAAPPRGDERVGTSGIEAMFDAELRGRDGRLESTSLEEFDSDGLLEPAVDGGDVVLTLDQDLQLAAEATLEHPVPPRDGKTTDLLWFANPVGAIVLLAPDGEILAAASAPGRAGCRRRPGAISSARSRASGR